jgi:hypothetical protein
MSNIVDYQVDKEGAYMTLNRSTPEDAAQALNQYFVGQGYKLESGSPVNGVYGRGSQALRVLLGAFHKRFSFNVHINPNPDGTTKVMCTRAEKGRWGGLIGYNQVTKETDRHKEALRGLM